MAKTLYLHVGMPKCASTTIQSALRVHADLFAAKGRFYGMPPRDETKGQGNVAVLLADIRAKRESRVREALEFFFERDTDVIMSSEMFIGLARNSMADQLIARAKEDGFTPKLICYVRRQDEWIESDYKQHIKGGSDWSEGIEALMQRRIKTKVLDYHWMIGNWARSVGRENITVVPLVRGQAELYPLERFLTFLGLDPALAHDIAPERQNVSPPVGLIEPMRYLKLALQAQGQKPADIPAALQRFLQDAPARIDVPKRRFLLSHKRRAALLERYENSNARLSETYLDGAAPFAAGVEEDGAPQTPLASEAAAVLASWIVSEPPPLPLPQKGAALSRLWPKRQG